MSTFLSSTKRSRNPFLHVCAAKEFMMKFHLLDHFEEFIRRSENASVSYTSIFKLFNVHTMKTRPGSPSRRASRT